VSKSPIGRYPFAKTVVILAVAFLVGVGLCGIDYLLAANGIGKSTEEFGVGPLDAVSLVVMVFSAAGLGLTLIVWMIASFVSSIGPSDGMNDTPAPLNLTPKVSQSEKRPNKPDDTNIDKQE
jgi:hypothetical protein